MAAPTLFPVQRPQRLTVGNGGRSFEVDESDDDVHFHDGVSKVLPALPMPPVGTSSPSFVDGESLPTATKKPNFVSLGHKRKHKIQGNENKSVFKNIFAHMLTKISNFFSRKTWSFGGKQDVQQETVF